MIYFSVKKYWETDEITDIHEPKELIINAADATKAQGSR